MKKRDAAFWYSNKTKCSEGSYVNKVFHVFLVLTGHIAVALVAGDYHTCVLREDSQVVCWGANSNGQIGIGTENDVGTSPGPINQTVDLGTGSFSVLIIYQSFFPFMLLLLAGMTAIEVAAGGSHTCAIRSDGKLVCWGSNGNGELGVGNQIDVGTSASQMGNNLVVVDLGTGAVIRFCRCYHCYTFPQTSAAFLVFY